MVWSSEDEKRLLVCIIDTSAKPDWVNVSTAMGDYTAEACRWTPEAEKLLLVQAIKASDLRPGPEIWEAVAQQLGNGANANGCSQKFYKLKREAEEMISKTGGSAPATPKKAKTPNGKTTASGKKRTKKVTDTPDDDEDDPISGDSPTKKKVKKEIKKSEAVIKDEDDQDAVDEKKATGVVENVQDEDADQA